MTVFESLMIMVAFASLAVAILSFNTEKRRRPVQPRQAKFIHPESRALTFWVDKF